LGSGSGKNIPNYFSKSSETVFGVKNTKILRCRSESGIRNLFDPGSGMEKLRSGIRDLGSEINIPDRNTGFLKFHSDKFIKPMKIRKLEAPDLSNW
jgi:hypothetical protein